MMDIENLQHQLSQARVRENFDRNHADAGGWEALIKLVNSGASLAAIGHHFGISRQRAAQIIKKGALRP